MKNKKIYSDIKVFDSVDELPKPVYHLMQKAIAIKKDAYSPYSNFQVGAAVRLANDEIITGNNQENSSYPTGLCAERVALFYASAHYPNQAIKTIALTASPADAPNEQPVPPCGSCRQVIAEYEYKFDQPIEIYCMGDRGNIIAVNSIKALLPLAFDRSFLK